MNIILNLDKTIQESANVHFERAKKARRKAVGARKTVLKFQKQMEKLEKTQAEIEETVSTKKVVKKEWYEKFRWFISSEGFLCLGGRDATSNEVLIKKHTDSDDVVFHTEAPGSPFFIIKTEGKTPTDITKQEVADATASFSKAWKIGVSNTEAFMVEPSQLSRTAPSGEYMPKGAFMVRGKRTFYQGQCKVAVGKLPDDRVMSGPEQAVKINCEKFSLVLQGRDKASDCAKKIAKKIDADVDDIIRVLPSGGCTVK